MIEMIKQFKNPTKKVTEKHFQSCVQVSGDYTESVTMIERVTIKKRK